MLTSYIQTLQKETERDIRKIESSEVEIISKSLMLISENDQHLVEEVYIEL